MGVPTRTGISCPRCGSTNVHTQVRSAGTESKTTYYSTGVKGSLFIPSGYRTYRSRRLNKTVGMCRSCGYSWDIYNPQNDDKGCAFFLVCLIFLPITYIVFFTEKVYKFCKKPKTGKKSIVLKALAVIAWLAFCILPIIALFYFSSKEAAEKTLAREEASENNWTEVYSDLSDFDYYVDDNKIHLKRYNGSSQKINVASSYLIDDVEYSVHSLEGTFINCKASDIIIPTGVQRISDNTFNGCDVKRLFLPSTLIWFQGWSYFHDVDKIFFGGSETNWSAICKVKRSDIEVKQIFYNCTPSDMQ